MHGGVSNNHGNSAVEAETLGDRRIMEHGVLYPKSPDHQQSLHSQLVPLFQFSPCHSRVLSSFGALNDFWWTSP